VAASTCSAPSSSCVSLAILSALASGESSGSAGAGRLGGADGPRAARRRQLPARSARPVQQPPASFAGSGEVPGEVSGVTGCSGEDA